MAVLLPSLEIFTGRGTPARAITGIRSRYVKLSICSSVKYLKKDVLQLKSDNYEDGVRWLYGHVKQSETPPFCLREGTEEEEKKRDYYVNTGYAIRTLREDFPELFYRELSFDIYRDDIVFKDPINVFAGIENYKSIFWALRFHGRIFFRTLWVEIISVWQPVENMIVVRWTVHGIPRIPWESHSRFDGTSEYKLDKDGKIYEHKVHNIAVNGPRKFQVLAVEQLIQSIGCPSTPRPTYFSSSSSSSSSIAPFQKLSAVKCYLASALTRPKAGVESQDSR